MADHTKSLPITETVSDVMRAAGTDNFMGRRTACVLGDQLHTITTVKGTGFWQRHGWLDLRKMVKADAKLKGLEKLDVSYLADASNWEWQNAWESARFMDTPASSVGLTANGSSMFMIHNGNDYRMLGKEFAAPDELSPKVWGKELIMCRPGPAGEENPDASTLGTWTGNMFPTYSFAASFYGKNQILVASAGDDGGIDLYLFDIRDLDDDTNIWVARSYRAISNLKFFKQGKEVEMPGLLHTRGVHSYLDLAWFTVVPPKDAKSKEPDIRLAVSVRPHVYRQPAFSEQSFTTYFDLPLKDDGSGEIDDRNGVTFAAGGDEADLCEEGVESGLIRDPAGRLRSFFADEQAKSIGSIYTTTAVAPLPSRGIAKTSEHVPAYADANNQATYVRPGCAFVLFESGAERSTDKAGNDIRTIPVLEFLFYGDGRYQVSHYGTIQSELHKAKLISNGDEKYIIGGIFAGPVPFPVQNYKGLQLGTEQIRIAGYVYGSEDKTDKENFVESGWHAGVKSEGHMVDGVGPAWDFSFDDGMASSSKNTYSETVGRELPVESSVEFPDLDYDNPKANGKAMVSTFQARLHIGYYKFIDSSGKIVNDATTEDPAASAKIFSTLTRMGAASTTLKSYPCYLVEAGNLLSYTPEAINKKMSELGYSGDNYFQEMVCQNAYPFNSEDDFLLYTWDGGNSNKTEFTAMNSRFNEQSWKLDTEAYLGISGENGVSVPIFGGEKLEWEVVAGGGYEQSRTASTEKESTWGLKIEGISSNSWGPQENENIKDVPDAVLAYSFRTYFLPVPDHRSGLDANYWTGELRSALAEDSSDESRLTPGMIDPGSGAWRIVFVVTKIDYVDPEKEPYIYSPDEQDPPSVLRE